MHSKNMMLPKGFKEYFKARIKSKIKILKRKKKITCIKSEICHQRIIVDKAGDHRLTVVIYLTI